MNNNLVVMILFLVGLLSSCKFNPNTTKLQYMPDMADGPVARAQRDYLDPPEHSVAKDAFLYPDTAEEAEDVLINPFGHFRNKTALVDEGKRLYGIFCHVCHGPNGKGDGTITDVYPRAFDLTQDKYADNKDGFFFYKITFGGASMPGYGHATSRLERWKITMYLRNFHERGN